MYKFTAPASNKGTCVEMTATASVVETMSRIQRPSESKGSKPKRGMPTYSRRKRGASAASHSVSKTTVNAKLKDWPAYLDNARVSIATTASSLNHRFSLCVDYL